jgi:hypothetical protein
MTVKGRAIKYDQPLGRHEMVKQSFELLLVSGKDRIRITQILEQVTEADDFEPLLPLLIQRVGRSIDRPSGPFVTDE